jgi:hypothetical protein
LVFDSLEHFCRTIVDLNRKANQDPQEKDATVNQEDHLARENLLEDVRYVKDNICYYAEHPKCMDYVLNALARPESFNLRKVFNFLYNFLIWVFFRLWQACIDCDLMEHRFINFVWCYICALKLVLIELYILEQ